MLPLDSIARHPLTAISSGTDFFDRLLQGPRWSAELRRCDRRYNQESGRALTDDDTTEYDYVGATITRGPGRWRLVDYYVNQTNAGRGSEWSCELRIVVPERVTGWDRLTVPMAVIRRRVPKAFDAFTSPNGSIAVVLDPTSTRVFRVEKRELGRELAVIAPDPSAMRGVEMTTMS